MVGETHKGSALGQRVKENRQAQGDLYVDRIKFETNVAEVASSKIPNADRLRRVFVPFQTPEGNVTRGELIVDAKKDIVDSFSPVTGKAIEGYVDVRLGQPDRMHKIAYRYGDVTDDHQQLRTFEVSSKELQERVQLARQYYKDLQSSNPNLIVVAAHEEYDENRERAKNERKNSILKGQHYEIDFDKIEKENASKPKLTAEEIVTGFLGAKRAAEASNLSKDVPSVEDSVPSLKDEEMKALRANADATVQSLRESAAATVAGLQSDADKSNKGLSL